MHPARIAAALVLLVAPLHAQQARQGPAPCAAPQHRQFDFWIGSWNVFDPQGRQVGTNAIERVLDGCALHERWEGTGPSRGFSYNIFDRTTGRWHQSWVDNTGLLLRLEGGLAGERMVLSGTTRNPDGATVLNRITWTPVSADSVRQLWETSNDGGTTWSVAFDGMYVRAGG